MSPEISSADLPHDLLAFLRAGGQLEYEAEGSDIGRIRLKGAAELIRSTIRACAGCQSIVDDPYEALSGYYLIDVVDLVNEAEDYGTEGLFSWIVALRCFGCIDSEHGDVIVFPDVSWTEIAADPLPFLNAQWAVEEPQRALPWLHFPFRAHVTEVTLAPYTALCPIHHSPVTNQRTRKPTLLEVFLRRNSDDWLDEYVTKFPCSGVPVNEEELLCCSKCREAEDAWIQTMDAAIPVLDVKPNEHGWIQCPGCGIRFSTVDAYVFQDGRHWSCGQKLRLVS